MGHHKTFTDNPKLDASVWKPIFNIGLGLGVIGLGASLGVGLGGDEATQNSFYFSWLVAFFFWFSIAVGGLVFVLLHHLSRGSWSAGLRRLAENFAFNLPVMAVLFIPVLLGMHHIYHWTHEEVMAEDLILQAKAGYLNTPFFIARAVFYLVVLSGAAWFFRTQSVKQDQDGDVAHTHKMRRASPVLMMLTAMSVTFGAFDWLMSTDPHWFSTMFGVYTFAGCMVSLYACLALSSMWLQSNGALTHTLTKGNLHDVGKMLFGFVIFWAYVSFSQYMLIWYANIPEETVWFSIRKENGWENIFWLLAFGHFLAPFFVLMSRHMKRNRKVLGLVAVWLLVLHYVDLYYVVMPTMPHEGAGHAGPHFHWLNIATWLGMGGIFVAMYARRFADKAMVAHKDPQLIASMEYDNV